MYTIEIGAGHTSDYECVGNHFSINIPVVPTYGIYIPYCVYLDILFKIYI